MHILLISNCEKRALKRTRAVLDSYALRSGEHAWITPITTEGLRELRAMLRRSATRQTCVACFRNDGRARMKLLWIVGNRRGFDHRGASPVATRTRTRRTAVPEWARIAAMLASAAGYMHDIGKFGRAFQGKLSAAEPIADPVRHEWLSLMVVRNMMAGASWDEAWSRVATTGKAKRYDDVDPFDGTLDTARDVLLYLIATHHKLPGHDGPNTIGRSAHVRDDSHVPEPVCAPSGRLQSAIQARLNKIRAMDAGDPLTWRALATIARMALILADHSVSSEKHYHPDAGAYANTDRETGQLNQDLEWHLEHVGDAAGDMVFRMLSLTPPSLSPEAIERISTPATGCYAWQETAARALTESHRDQRRPHLILNMAGTGSGKTRANVRTLCALNEGGDVRIATALNLRTLTLQTADAYAEQLHIGRDELACVIGDRLSRVLHERGPGDPSTVIQDTPEDDDGNAVEPEIEVALPFHYSDAPDWLKHFLKTNPELPAIIGAPVLVSTVDFLIAAGDPNRQAHHALAALRLMSSDLILDEIDSYDPKPLLAVLRLVMMAALFGRHVVASSATLSKPVARLLWLAYAKGAEMRARLVGDGAFRTALIHDRASPVIADHNTVDSFLADYDHYVCVMLATLDGQSYRVPFLQPVGSRDKRAWQKALCTAIGVLHANQAWVDPRTGKELSIGLVRVANVRHAIETASYIGETLPQARVACYHANLFAIQRFHIEQRLDHLLTRKGDDGQILSDPEIRGMLDELERKTLMLIVVATPVEEIGRDHDFDWAVIDPSSAQSIVQTAGRVNRHRLVSVNKPNIALMQFNYRFCANPNPQNPRVFYWPGFERADNPYSSHDLATLFDWPTVTHVDARMRLDYRHLFAKLDDRAITATTERPFRQMTSDDDHRNQWMAKQMYMEARLRDVKNTVEITLDESGRGDTFRIKESRSEDKPRSFTLDKIVPRVERAWLSLNDDAAASLADELGVSRNEAVRVSIPVYWKNDDTPPQSFVRRHCSFGFWISYDQ